MFQFTSAFCTDLSKVKTLIIGHDYHKGTGAAWTMKTHGTRAVWRHAGSTGYNFDWNLLAYLEIWSWSHETMPFWSREGYGNNRRKIKPLTMPPTNEPPLREPPNRNRLVAFAIANELNWTKSARGGKSPFSQRVSWSGLSEIWHCCHIELNYWVFQISLLSIKLLQ